MNINLIYRIENIIKRINADSFDQELISSLIICVREQLPVNGMAREIGDFIAHPDLPGFLVPIQSRELSPTC